MKVKTLDTELFVEHCRLLESAVRRDFVPDVVVCIARGGVYVGAEMFDKTPHIIVTCQRSTTEDKENASPLLWNIIRSMPLCVRDAMRIIEARWLTAKEFEIPELPLIDVGKARRILVVDDAVDSGATLRAVVNAIYQTDVEVRTAAITVTRRDAFIRPDYCIYDNQTLVRFPWSKDMRKK
jgi:hypoxanthine phosphoribosyltransferase